MSLINNTNNQKLHFSCFVRKIKYFILEVLNGNVPADLSSGRDREEEGKTKF